MTFLGRWSVQVFLTAIQASHVQVILILGFSAVRVISNRDRHIGF